MPRFLHLGLFTGMMLAPLVAATAAETATIPYAKLDEIWQKIGQIDSKKLAVVAQVSSKNKDVKPSAITMTIKSASGAIPIKIGPEGDLLEFPRTDTLRKENPPIETNQPKGSLVLILDLGLALPIANSFPYMRLVEGVAEANKVAKEQAGMLAIAMPNVKAVVFVFPKSSAGKATVEIPSIAGKKIFPADAGGQAKVILDSKLAAENPTVTLSERPKRILLSAD